MVIRLNQNQRSHGRVYVNTYVRRRDCNDERVARFAAISRHVQKVLPLSGHRVNSDGTFFGQLGRASSPDVRMYGLTLGRRSITTLFAVSSLIMWLPPCPKDAG
jgi:hypothetical protein